MANHGHAEEKRRKAEELLLNSEAESEKQKAEAAAKKAAKKERQLRQKAEAQRALEEERAAAVAAAAGQAGAGETAPQHPDAEVRMECQEQTRGGPFLCETESGVKEELATVAGAASHLHMWTCHQAVEKQARAFTGGCATEADKQWMPG